MTNVYSAMQAGIKHGALGLTVAHWAGVGHITHQTMAWPGLLTAAGLGWNANISSVNMVFSNLQRTNGCVPKFSSICFYLPFAEKVCVIGR